MNDIDRPDYHVSQSRTPALALGLIFIAISAFFVCRALPGRFQPGFQYVIWAVAGLNAVVGLSMLRDAIRPPWLMMLNHDGVTFKIPRLKILWQDIKDANVAIERDGRLIVELTLADLQSYVAQVDVRLRKALDYEIISQSLCYRLDSSVDIATVRAEIESRLLRSHQATGRCERDEPIAGDEVFPFNLRLLRALTVDRFYRAYVCECKVYLIRIAGQGNVEAIATQFGPFKMLIAEVLRRDTKTPEEIAEMDCTPPGHLLRDHKHNFSFAPADVTQAIIDGRSPRHSHGPHVGKLLLVFRDGKRQYFQFEDAQHAPRSGAIAATTWFFHGFERKMECREGWL